MGGEPEERLPHPLKPPPLLSGSWCTPGEVTPSLCMPRGCRRSVRSVPLCHERARVCGGNSDGSFLLSLPVFRDLVNKKGRSPSFSLHTPPPSHLVPVHSVGPAGRGAAWIRSLLACSCLVSSADAGAGSVTLSTCGLHRGCPFSRDGLSSERQCFPCMHRLTLNSPEPTSRLPGV